MQESSLEEYSVDQIFEKFGGRHRFERYVEILFEENEKINLVSRETSREDLYRLIADCLIPAYLSDRNQLITPRKWTKVLDIGSGGGLPSFPLALAMENVDLTLIERTGKKAMFLRRTLQALGVKGRVLNCNFREFVDNPQIVTVTGELPTSGPMAVPKYDYVSIRWVKADFAMIRRAMPLLSEADKSNCLLYYSPAEELQKLEKGQIRIDSYSYRFVGDSQEKRHLTVFRHK